MFGSIHPRKRVFAPHSDEVMTKQSSKKECDIHEILKQYQKTGIITHIQSRQAEFQDLPAAMDYQEAIEVVRAAQEGFAELPSKVRERFANDPFNLLAALNDPKMRDELVELGILNAPRSPAPPPAPPPAPKSDPEGAE